MDSSRGNKFDYVVTGLLKVNNNVVGTSYTLKSLFPTRRINYTDRQNTDLLGCIRLLKCFNFDHKNFKLLRNSV